MTKSVWIIIDEKTGNANQAIAVAKALGMNYETKNLSYNFLSVLPNRLKFDSLMGVNLELSDDIKAPFPDIIISSGRKPASVSNYIKKLNPSSFVVHIMKPDLSYENFDLVCLPMHDKSKKNSDLKNVIFTIGAPSFIDQEQIKMEGEALKKKLKLPSPYIVLSIGGKTKDGSYSEEEMINLVKEACNHAKKLHGSLLITTSRRTEESLSSKLLQEIDVPFFFYDWHKDKSQKNPYLGFLYLADYFIVTADSVSTCSEALTTGKPLYLHQNKKVLYKKHIKFLNYLYNKGYIRYLKEGLDNLESWEYQPLKEAEKISNIIKENLNVNSIVASKNS